MMGRWKGWYFGSAVFVLLTALGTGGLARAQTDMQQLQRQIEELRRSNQEMQQRMQQQQQSIDSLERQLRESQARPVQPEAAAKPPAETVKWNELMVGSSKLRFYGFLRLDTIYDDSRPNNTQTIAFIRSEDPKASASIGNRKNQHDLTIHPRLTRFGLDLDGPRVGSLGNGKLTGKLEIDFYNNGLLGQSESREAVRMRHGYLKLAWNDLSLLAGQTADVISPIFPIVNPDLVMWGAGNLGDRRPQLRFEYLPAVGPGRLILQSEVGLTGADDNQDLDAAGAFGSGFRDGETSGKPTLQGRIAYRTPLSPGQTLELGVWGHRAWEKPDTKFAGRNVFDSDAVGMDLTLPVYRDILWLKGEIWKGKNVDDVRGGIFQGINTASGKEIRSSGGWAEVGLKPFGQYSISAGYATDDPRNKDLPLGGRSRNKIYYLANRAKFAPIDVGFDYLNWTTEYIGFKEGDDNRFQFFLAYPF